MDPAIADCCRAAVCISHAWSLRPARKLRYTQRKSGSTKVVTDEPNRDIMAADAGELGAQLAAVHLEAAALQLELLHGETADAVGPEAAGAGAEARLAAAYVVGGLTFGDEGKGTTVDYLVRATGCGLVVRYNGGPQAAHHVVSEGGAWHCFAQFGAGTLVPGCRTLCSARMLVAIPELLNEETFLRARHGWAGAAPPFPALAIRQRDVLSRYKTEPAGAAE